MITIGDKVRVKDQDITGIVVAMWNNKVVIRDLDSEYESPDDRLEYRTSDLELMNEELKEYTCNIVLDFGRSYMAKSREEFVDMVLSDFYQEHGYKLNESELKNITEVK